MKKIITLALAILLAFTLFSCAEPEAPKFTVTFEGIEERIDPVTVKAGEKFKLPEKLPTKPGHKLVIKIGDTILVPEAEYEIKADTVLKCSWVETVYTVSFKGITRDPIVLKGVDKLKLSKDFEVVNDKLTILRINGKRVYRNTEIPITGDTVIDVERLEASEEFKNPESPKGIIEYIGETSSGNWKLRYFGADTNKHELIIPDKHEGKYVEILASSHHMQYISSIQLPDGLKKIINSQAFLNSTITEIDLPEGLEVIGYWTFNNCIELKDLIIPSTITEMKTPIINLCPELKEITVMKKKADCSQWYHDWHGATKDHKVTVHYLDGDVVYPETATKP